MSDLEKRVKELEGRVDWVYNFLHNELKELNNLVKELNKMQEKTGKKVEKLMETQKEFDEKFQGLINKLNEKKAIHRGIPT